MSSEAEIVFYGAEYIKRANGNKSLEDVKRLYNQAKAKYENAVKDKTVDANTLRSLFIKYTAFKQLMRKKTKAHVGRREH